MAEFAERIMSLVSGADYRPITLKAMSRRLKVTEEEYVDFRATVKRMVTEHVLGLTKDKRLELPEARTGLVVGLFRRSAKGFGFVRPHGGTGKSDHIYIPIEASGDASSGDEVAVKLIKRPRRAGFNREGKIVEIVARATGVFVGTYFESGRDAFVRVDGTTFHGPIYVGDPGAKGARPGEKVAIEIIRYPSAIQQGEGVVTEVLGERGQPGVDTLSVIRAFGIPDTFDDTVLDEAREQGAKFNEEDIGTRRDLRELLTVTIDPATARDFDDAISLFRDDNGHWSLAVHIADVSHFVPEGSALDRSAKHRGTSVYLPDRVIPMLPEILSNSLASLQAGRTRYTLSAFLDFNPEGILTAKEFARTAIRADYRFSYEQALGVMKDLGERPEGVTDEVAAMLKRMLQLAMILRKRRFERGALELSLPEVKISLGEHGEVSGAGLAEHDESHQVIEEFMLAANEAVAETLTSRGLEFLRRTHADPEPQKLMEFAEFVRSLGVAIDLPQSRFELQRVLRETVGRPEEYAIHYGMLRSLKQAIYTPEAEGHYALASEDYCHFTSPIRRYPDLQVHRQLIGMLEGKRSPVRADALTQLGEHCTKTERRAEAAEREIIKVKLLTYLEGHVGETFPAVVVGVEDFGFFCRLLALPAEGLIHVTSLADDYYYLEEGTHTLVGRRSGKRYRLGDRLQVRVAHVDVDRRDLGLVLAEEGAPGRGDARSAVRRGEGRGRPGAEQVSESKKPRRGANSEKPREPLTARNRAPKKARKKGPKRKK
jgi:ribonuclease R